MSVKIEYFITWRQSQCWRCRKNKLRNWSWEKLSDAWFCLDCWSLILTKSLLTNEIKTDKNNGKYSLF